MDDIYTDILKQFIDDRIDNICDLTGGHINKSMLVTAGGDRYVLQCLAPGIFADHLFDMESNYIQYKAACEQSDDGSGDRPGEWCCPEWIRDRIGQYFHKDEEGRIFRLYRYIEGDRAVTGSEADIYEAGVGLGKITKILKKCDKSRIRTVFPHLHDLDHCYGEYLSIEDPVNNREPLLDKIISEHIDEMRRVIPPSKEVIHGDAKLGNMIFRNGKAVGFVDLDTIMCGSLYDDIADCMRSCCPDTDLEYIDDRTDRFLQGFKKGSDIAFTGDEKFLILHNLKRNRFMLGLRYYTDHLTGNKYFTEAHPGDNIDRSYRLLQSIQRTK